MGTYANASASGDDTAADTFGAEFKVDALAEILDDLISTLANAGRLSAAEARTWRGAVDAVVLGRPELSTPGGQVVTEAERILRAA